MATSESSVLAEVENVTDDGKLQQSPVSIEDREWRIQCKRYKEIGPTLMRQIVKEVIPKRDQTPYGFIIAAACDVSAETMAIFREEAIDRGIIESHLWTKAHLEDILFLPENGHLLFAYFGISLGIRRQSQTQRIRSLIALKRKLLRAFEIDSVEGLINKATLVRDIADECYPYEEKVSGFQEMRAPPWHLVAVDFIHPPGLIACRYVYNGWVKEDGSWDILEESRQISAFMEGQHGWAGQSNEEWARHELSRQLYEKVPENEQKQIRELRALPFRHILEVDPMGDPEYAGPHLFCLFEGIDGPYTTEAIYVASGQWPSDDHQLDTESRKPLFDVLRKGGADS